MGLTRWLLALCLYQAAVCRGSEVRYLRHSGRRESSSGDPAAGSLGLVSGIGLGANATENPADLLFEDEADPSAGLKEELVVRGQEVVFECVVPEDAKEVVGDDSVEGEVRWYHDGTQIKGDLRTSIMWTGRLVLSHAVSSDSGVWWCRRSGREGPKLRLVVTIPPERPYLEYGDARLAPGGRLTTRERNSITLNCVVEGGNPAPSIAWVLGGEDITPSSQMKSDWKADEGVFYSTSNLTLPSVGKELHNTSVACVVRHPALPVPVPVPLRLNVQYPPAFRLRRWPVWGTPVREGATISLLCAVDANPPSSPTWVKVTERGTTEVASSGGWLNLTRVSDTDRGWYKCATVHTFGRFASHSVYINVMPGGRTASVSSKNSLLLRKTTYSDGGRYRCVASDATRTVESDDVDVVVSGAPVVEAVNSTVLSIAGRPTALSAQVCGRPYISTLTWLPPAHLPPVMPGENKGRFRAHNLTAAETPDCQYAVMTIIGVRSSDAGNWVLVGVNDRGASAALIRLNITAAAHSVTANGARARIPAHACEQALATAVVLIVFYAAQSRLWA